MKFTLQQIFAALAATGDNGAQMIADLQEEFGNLRTEAGNHRTAKKDILQALGIQDGADTGAAIKGIQETLAALKNTGKNPGEIGAQIAALTADIKRLSEEVTAEKTGRQQERDKRINATKLNKALAALQAGNATNPEVIAKLVMDNIIAKDDDSLAYNDNGKEIAVDDGIKAFLTANPWAVKNTQQPGGGSGAGNGAGGRRYSKAELSAMTPEQINANWADVQESMKTI